jgi:dinuclear metal center YbgI/SA1388 family protein
MICSEIIKYFEDWAPKEIAWQKDNVGLQVGSLNRKVKNILLSLELTEPVINYAIKKDCNFIFTHHPLLFKPLKKIDTQNDKNSSLVESLIKNDITLYSAHTNLDFTSGGVSFELAKLLKLNKIEFLLKSKENQIKISVFVPVNAVENVAFAMFEAGGGIIGEYKNCSFRTQGKGTFQGSIKSNPAVGRKENYETVDEIKLEVLVNSWNLNKVIEALLKTHPYEEIAYDIYKLDNENPGYGAGAIGELEFPMKETDFLNHVAEKLKIKNFRYVLGKKNKIKKVAVCGGAGIDLLKTATTSGAEAFITADIKYHTFLDSDGKILLIDAGHYETEVPVLNVVYNRLKSFLDSKKSDTRIFKYNRSTNPIHFYNNKGA